MFKVAPLHPDLVTGVAAEVIYLSGTPALMNVQVSLFQSFPSFVTNAPDSSLMG